ncbi:MAG: hypothetical protein D3903_17960 [Candidatus Electrothrix sp. GM3_4]|nr:hypothetical protein [Candidatus Electrothrix sp. GM3_4]
MNLEQFHLCDTRSVARAIFLLEDQAEIGQCIMQGLDQQRLDRVLTVGITGPPGAGKSTLTSSLVQQLRLRLTLSGFKSDFLLIKITSKNRALGQLQEISFFE